MKFSKKSIIAFVAIAATTAPSVVQAADGLVEFGPTETVGVADWTGAQAFCKSKSMRLAYRWEWCHGEISPDNIYGGQKQGDHWAAINDGANQWVQVGQWDRGVATEWRGCQTHWEIANYDPLWGSDLKDKSWHAENDYILCSKATEYTLEVFKGAKFDLDLLLNSGWIYPWWGCSEATPCVAKLDDKNRLWLGLPVKNGGYGPDGMYAGKRVWHTNSAMDTYELLMGKVDSAGNWDPEYKGTGDQKLFQMESNDKISRKDGPYSFTRIPIQDKTGGGGGPDKPDPTTYGDPHFITWGGDAYDFHGGCDLVLLQDNEFANGLGLNVHIRTNIKTWWSHIKSAAVQIGDHTLEITADTGLTRYWINGGDETKLETGDATLGDFPVHFRYVNDHHTSARIDLGHGDAIGIETFKDFVRVNVKDKSHKAFKGSIGLLGSYQNGGKMVGRDGKTVIENTDEFGQEWMVRATDSLLFHDADASQIPLACPMPDEFKTGDARRRLGEGSISEEDAALACARVSEAHRDACIFDVMATQDKEMVGSY